MEKLTSTQEFENYIALNELAAVYYSTLLCGVCHAMKPQVEKLLENYPNIPIKEVVMGDVPEISSQQTVFSSPAFILYAQGKEFVRQAGYLRLDQLDSLLTRIS